MKRPFPPRIRARELRAIEADYEAALPGWRRVHRVGFVRVAIPVSQVIGFEALSDGTYRPMSGIGILPMPTLGLLVQFLDVRHRESTLAQHASRWPVMAGAMQKEFFPLPGRPLSLAEVRDRIASESNGKMHYLAALACLDAFMGRTRDALDWIDRIDAFRVNSPECVFPHDQEYIRFSEELRHALRDGNAKALIETRSALALKQLGFKDPL